MKHRNILITLTLYTLAMLCVPVAFWTAHYTWTVDESMTRLLQTHLWLALTYTGGTKPYAYIQIVIVVLLCAWTFRRTYRPWTIVLVCALSVGGTQAIKSGVKHLMKEPRPYVVTLSQQQNRQPENFYELDDAQKQAFIRQSYAHYDDPVLSDYQQTELGYSFPSGHSTFAVSWLLLIVGFTQSWQHRGRTLLRLLALLWAVGVLVSRVKLGMHYPIDLFAATLLAWIWHLPLLGYFLPYLKQHFKAKAA